MPNKNKKGAKKDDSRLFAFLAVLLTIVGFVIALLAKREDKYVMFYAKQSLVLFIAWIISGAAMIVPIVGWFAGPILYVITLVLWIIAIVNSLSGKEKETPLIGQYARKINL